MKNLLRIVPIIIALLLVPTSCGNSDDDVNFNLGNGGNNDGGGLGSGSEPDDCLGFEENDLILSIQSQKAEAPAKISILFKVTDNLGNPVAGLTAEQFTIYEQGRNDDCFNVISSSESQARISPNAQVFNNNALLVLDLSNSVLESSLEELKTAAVSFITNVMPANETDSFQMAIYWFDGEDELHLLNPLTSSISELTGAINDITADISNDPSTDLYGAVIKSTEIANNLIKETDNTIIGATSVTIFTDGTDQASRYTESSALNAVANADSNVSLFTIGLGAEIDQEVLREIGKTASVVAANKEELETTFNQISARVTEQANSFYLFEYCTPKRDGSGENNLVIQLTDGAQQGAVQTKFSANGFTGGCE